MGLPLPHPSTSIILFSFLGSLPGLRVLPLRSSSPYQGVVGRRDPQVIIGRMQQGLLQLLLLLLLLPHLWLQGWDLKQKEMLFFILGGVRHSAPRLHKPHVVSGTLAQYGRTQCIWGVGLAGSTRLGTQ